jgi:hypothetical protein
VTGPPNIDPKKIDFSQFHPFDHIPGGTRCFALYGGPKQHMKLSWEFYWSSELRRVTLCRIGRHKYVDGWQRKSKDDPWQALTTCRDCARVP